MGWPGCGPPLLCVGEEIGAGWRPPAGVVDDTAGCHEEDDLLLRLRRLDLRRPQDLPFAVLLVVVRDFDRVSDRLGTAGGVGLVDDLVAGLRRSWFGRIYRCGPDRFATIVRTHHGDSDFDAQLSNRARSFEEAVRAAMARQGDAAVALDVRVAISTSMHEGQLVDADTIWWRAQRGATEPERVEPAGHQPGRDEPRRVEPDRVASARLWFDGDEREANGDEVALLAELQRLDCAGEPPDPPFGLVLVGPTAEWAGAGLTTLQLVDDALAPSRWPVYLTGHDDVVILVPAGSPATAGELARRIVMTAGRHQDMWVAEPGALLLLHASSWSAEHAHGRGALELWRELRRGALLERFRAAEERMRSLAAALEAETGWRSGSISCSP